MCFDTGRHTDRQRVAMSCNISSTSTNANGVKDELNIHGPNHGYVRFCNMTTDCGKKILNYYRFELSDKMINFVPAQMPVAGISGLMCKFYDDDENYGRWASAPRGTECEDAEIEYTFQNSSE